MKWPKRWKTQTLLLLAVIGPGFITANVDNDAGGIYTYSFAGAQFGYSLLWTIIPMTLALIVIQEMSARMGACTGKGLSDLIREEYGLRITFVMMLLLVATNFTNVMAEFAGVASSMELFHVSKFISVPIAAAIVWLVVVKGNYKSVEKVFLDRIFFLHRLYHCRSAFATQLDCRRGEHSPAATEAALFRVPGYVYMVTGIIGATIAPWMQFYLQASVVEKGVTMRDYGKTESMSWWDQFLLHWWQASSFWRVPPHSTNPGTASLAVRPMRRRLLGPLAGRWAQILFGAGLFNASLFAASILPLSTAYTVCEGLGFESGLDKKFSEASVFYWLYTALVAAGAAVILLPRFPLLKMPVLSQVFNGVLLPFVLIFMLLLINKTSLMGKNVNSRFFNWVAWGTASVMIVLSVLLVFQ